jgi:hypothetical protein
MIRVEKYKHEHLNEMREMGLRVEDNRRMIIENPETWKMMAERSEAYSVFVNGDILFSGGILMLQEGFGEAWLLCSVLVYIYPLTVYRMASRLLNKTIEDCNLYRVQATPRTNWSTGYRFVESLGFQREGVLRKYGLDREDCYMYGRIS